MPAAATPPTPSGTPAAAPVAPSPALPVVLFLVLAGVVATAGVLSYSATAADLRRQKHRELASIAALKVEEIDRWHDERLSDAAFAAVAPLFPEALPAPAAAAPTAPLAAWLGRLRDLGDYSDVALVSSAGAIGPTSGIPAAELADDGARQTIRAAIRQGRPFLSNVHRLGVTGPLHMDLVAPVAAAGGRAAGAVLLRIDPYRYFFRTVQSWPTPSPTAETLLVWRDGGRVRFANELRHWADDPLALSVPLDRRQDPAARAAAGETGTVEGIDYRGRRVLAAMQPVPDSPWALVVKVDEVEAMAPLRARAASMAVAAFALVLASGAGATLWWRQQRARFDRQRVRAEVERSVLLRKVEWLTRYGGDMVFLVDQRFAIVEANDRAALALRREPAALVGLNVRELSDPAAPGDFENRIREAPDKGLALFETRFRRSDGTTFPVEVSVRTLDVGGTVHHHAIVRDITERKRAEEALRASEEKFRATFEQAGLGIALLGVDGRYLETNRAFRRMLGLQSDDLRGRRVVDVVHPEEAATAREGIEALLGGRRDVVETPRRFRRRDGGFVETVVRARAVRGPAGDVQYALAVVEDVSDRKRMEAQLVLADRLASVGTLAAGVAHEINNPLAYIGTNLDFSIEKLRRSAAPPEVLRALEEAREGGARVREIVRDLKTFSRAHGDVRAPVDVREVVRSAANLAGNEIRHRARLELDLRDVPAIIGCEHRLGQVLLNLLINAAQATREGHADANLIRVATRTAAGGAVEIEVSDTGVGIEPGILHRIFDPFFTTKPVGVGTGLGLAICHGIVSDLGGQIRVASQLGRGTTVTVALPPAPGATAGPPARAATPLPAERRGRILVVDDERFVGRAVARILSPPHEVVLETSARAALERIDRGDGPFDLVLCDLMMPEMTGMELHRRLAATASPLAARLVFLTGGAFTADARAYLDGVPNPCVEKPLEATELRTLVAGLLAVG